MSLFLMLNTVFAMSGVLMFATAKAYNHPRLRAFRVHHDRGCKVVGGRLYRKVFANMALSAGLVYAMVFGLHAWLIDDSGHSSWGRSLVDFVFILGLYDGLYYLMHRFLFHEWKVLRRVHAVHHVVRHPTAPDSLYLHPVENVCGLGLLVLCTWIVGPVSPATFGCVFAVYSFLNIMIHTGMNLPFFGFRILGFMARKHDTHHTSMKGGNYASITPLCDVLFGTAE